MSQKNLSANHCAQANDTRSFCPSLLSDTATISVHSETDGTPSPFSRGQVSPFLQFLYPFLLIASPVRQLHYFLCRSIPQRRYIKLVLVETGKSIDCHLSAPSFPL